MIDIKKFRKDPQYFEKKSAEKDIKIDSDKILKLDKENRDCLQQIEEINAFKNKFSQGKPTAKQIKEIKAKNEELKKLEKIQRDLQSKLDNLLIDIPNPAKDDVVIGKSDKDNKVLRQEGKLPKFKFKPFDYMALAQKLDLIDTKRAAKVSGTRFGYIKNQLVELQFALMRYILEVVKEYNFQPILPPVMISGQSMDDMGYLQHGGKDDAYYFAKDDLYLIGTSEQSIGPYFKNEILSIDDLPIRFIGYSTCFRREAGSYGKDTKGILRVHQFDKMEMFSFVHPDQSDKEHELLLSIEEKLMKGLELPYQVVNICSGDLGHPAARKWDIETWIPSENKYRETHSTSTCTDFQARRLHIRFKDKAGKIDFVHTVNGTAFAFGRILIAIIENYQTKDQTIKVPKILHKYCSFKEIK